MLNSTAITERQRRPTAGGGRGPLRAAEHYDSISDSVIATQTLARPLG